MEPTPTFKQVNIGWPDENPSELTWTIDFSEDPSSRVTFRMSSADLYGVIQSLMDVHAALQIGKPTDQNESSSGTPDTVPTLQVLDGLRGAHSKAGGMILDVHTIAGQWQRFGLNSRYTSALYDLLHTRRKSLS